MHGHTKLKTACRGGLRAAAVISGAATAVQGVGLCSGAEIQKMPPA